ncbi:hypothetical protein B1218_37620, partial [Pseudomonas ogarae]
VWQLVALPVHLGLSLRQSRHSGRPHPVSITDAPDAWPTLLPMILLVMAMLIFARHLLLLAAVEVAQVWRRTAWERGPTALPLSGGIPGLVEAAMPLEA